MRSYFRAVALAYDGTLTQGARPDPEVLTAVGEIRRDGRKVVLVTGRIFAELCEVFPDCSDHFDLIVAENGAVVVAARLTMPLVTAVPTKIDRILRNRGIPFRRGEVIVATHTVHEAEIRDVLNHCSLDCHLLQNRGELMLIPAGISKAVGLRYALLQLGISPHSTIAVGDAENDLAMLEICEVAVAVENAVASVKERADVVLTEPGGNGVVRFLREVALEGEMRLRRRRRQVILGRSVEGGMVSLPSSGVDVIVGGESGSGKSFVTGLIAEQLVQLGYVVCIFDPEGDHAPLGRLPNVVTLGGPNRLPAVEDLAQIFEQSGTSVVVDLALVPRDRGERWTTNAIHFLERRRAMTGVPHWLVVDEAHVPLSSSGRARSSYSQLKGHCLVTYRPEDLDTLVTAEVDYVLVVAGIRGIDRASLSVLSGITRFPLPLLTKYVDGVRSGQGLLMRISEPAEIQCVAFSPRWVSHVRHWHKYASAQLPARQRFYFRGPAGLTGAVAANMEQFHRELRCTALATVRHHCGGGDFSRWVADVLQDERLASALRLGEQRLCEASSEAQAEAARAELIAAIETRYGSS
jgi:HAD superfamily hydrolase (TIGR01484 family)